MRMKCLCIEMQLAGNAFFSRVDSCCVVSIYLWLIFMLSIKLNAFVSSGISWLLLDDILSSLFLEFMYGKRDDDLRNSITKKKGK